LRRCDPVDKKEKAVNRKGARILVVDDDRHILNELRAALTDHAYEVYIAETGKEAHDKIAQYAFDLIVLDILLPDTDGLEICQWVRNQIHDRIPIIILTVKDNDDNQLQAFSAFANDYVTKPFSMPVFLARVKAHLHNVQPAGPVFIQGPLKVDFSRNSVLVNAQEIKLTPNEYKILEILIRNRGRLVAPGTLIQKLWPEDDGIDRDREREVVVYIHNLRRKIEQPGQRRFIKTQHRWGYRFLVEE
jgi:two-component system, OmpR family, KDP operon response regulator KdpE